VPQRVQADRFGDPSPLGDATHDPFGAVPVQPLPVGAEEDRPSSRSPIARSTLLAVRGANGIAR
jgi:hypothetical protein